MCLTSTSIRNNATRKKKKQKNNKTWSRILQAHLTPCKHPKAHFTQSKGAKRNRVVDHLYSECSHPYPSAVHPYSEYSRPYSEYPHPYSMCRVPTRSAITASWQHKHCSGNRHHLYPELKNTVLIDNSCRKQNTEELLWDSSYTVWWSCSIFRFISVF